MKRIILLSLSVMLLAGSASATTGREIIDKSDAAAKPNSVKSDVVMVIVKGGTRTEKLFTLTSLDGKEGEDRALIAFHKPSRIKLLTHTHKGRDDDQWLKMSSGKVKRISQSSKKKSFVNSHFTYEDISSRNIDDYDYTLLGQEEIGGVSCYRVESVRTHGKKVYDKTILYIGEADWFVRRIDFYQKGKYLKRLENFEISMVAGYLTPHEVVMYHVSKGGETRMTLQNVTYDEPMKPTDFRKEALR